MKRCTADMPNVDVDRYDGLLADYAVSYTHLMWLADSLGIRREQVMACGDGYNDITMISEAGIGVAMELSLIHILLP